eukprot:10411648-Prorocentrum_lima.AAC.1
MKHHTTHARTRETPPDSDANTPCLTTVSSLDCPPRAVDSAHSFSNPTPAPWTCLLYTSPSPRDSTSS